MHSSNHLPAAGKPTDGTNANGRSPKLREQVHHVFRVLHYSLRTEEAYT